MDTTVFLPRTAFLALGQHPADLPPPRRRAPPANPPVGPGLGPSSNGADFCKRSAPNALLKSRECGESTSMATCHPSGGRLEQPGHPVSSLLS